MTDDIEIWLPVVEAPEAYEVSSRGHVRSRDRISPYGSEGRTRRSTGQMLVPWITQGRPMVGLYYAGRKHSRPIHQLVAEAFLGERPYPTAETRHLNDDKPDNRATNLAYGSKSDNMNDLVANGLHHYAKRDRCKYGHPYTEANTRWRGTARICRECDKRTSKERYHRNRERST